MSDAARYLGIDPGLNRTGYALLERSPRGPVLCEGGLIRSTRGRSLAERVHEISSGLCEVLDEFQPAVLAIEHLRAKLFGTYAATRHAPSGEGGPIEFTLVIPKNDPGEPTR